MDPTATAEMGKGPWLRENLISVILSMAPGDLFPSDRVLVDRYQVSRVTVQREIATLVDNGLLERKPGKGTFVRRPSGMVDTLSSFTDMRPWHEAKAHIYSVRTVRATESDRRSLGLEQPAQVVLVHRLRLMDGEPMAVERIRLAHPRFAGLTRHKLTGTSLYRTLELEYEAFAYSADQTASVEYAGAEDAKALGLPPGAAVMRIDRVTRDNMGLVMDLGTALCHPERFKLHTRVGLA